MSINGEDPAPPTPRVRLDADEEVVPQPKVRPRLLIRRGDAAAVPDISFATPADNTLGRQWNRVGDFLTGTYDNVQRVWSATGVSRQYALSPVSSRFIESDHSPTLSRVNQLYLATFEDDLHHHNVQLPSRLPRRLWIFLAKILGVKLNRSDKPILATALHVFTLTAALTFAIPGAWYTVYDIHSKFSKTTVLIGSVQIIIGFAWACLGVYAHNLAGRLFSNKNFTECVRMHSKTFIKISTSWLTLILGIIVIIVNCYEAAPVFYDDTCGTAQIEILVCQVFFVGRVVYAVMSLIWNFIVTYVLFSVCRTHTVGIRRFMRELNVDAKSFEDFCLKQYNIQRNSARSTDNSLEDSWFLWDDHTITDSDEDSSNQAVFMKSASGVSIRRRQSGYQHMSTSTATAAEDQQEPADSTAGDGGRELKDVTTDAKPPEISGSINGQTAESGIEEGVEEFMQPEGSGRTETEAGGVPVLLSNEDLLFSYWKFLRRLCVTSRFLQRWLASWIAFVIMWDGYFIIYWTSHGASLVAILQFVVPLLILLLVCSAYAEVNAEGQRLLKSICPMEERLAILFYFNQQPLTVRVFSFTVTYNAMMTVILGFSVAFASRMILDEIAPT